MDLIAGFPFLPRWPHSLLLAFPTRLKGVSDERPDVDVCCWNRPLQCYASFLASAAESGPTAWLLSSPWHDSSAVPGKSGSVTPGVLDCGGSLDFRICMGESVVEFRVRWAQTGIVLKSSSRPMRLCTDTLSLFAMLWLWPYRWSSTRRWISNVDFEQVFPTSLSSFGSLTSLYVLPRETKRLD